MEELWYVTSTDFDIRAITTFGLHAKPDSFDPIGRFGTGLKYAIAILLREGCDVKIYIRGVEHSFSVVPTTFRNKDVVMIRMHTKRSFWDPRPRTQELPFTLELGKHWKLWQALRELESNTRDEGGRSFFLKSHPTGEAFNKKNTYVIVSGMSLRNVLENEAVFLNLDADSILFKTREVEVRKGSSNYLYYKGIRVLELEKPSLFTYNFCSYVELTEDRSLAFQSFEKRKIVTAWTTSEDKQLLTRVIKANPDDRFEGSLDFDSCGVSLSTPGPIFNAAVRSTPTRLLSPRVASYALRAFAPPSLTEYQMGWNAALDAVSKEMEIKIPKSLYKQPGEDIDDEIPF